MITLRQQNNSLQSRVNEYVADTMKDIKDLPTDKSVYPGSVCIVIETADVFMLNSKREWKLIS